MDRRARASWSSVIARWMNCKECSRTSAETFSHVALVGNHYLTVEWGGLRPYTLRAFRRHKLCQLCWDTQSSKPEV
ncbi:conserved protein of unknown function [Pseudomonas marincola]|uniref:Uncharacterized protein n=1 Tax=Pseudomonas marincola TaxID=437900 RepID=A0A653E1P0_9PSED|nr:conserved protein of unknown function [Pseudomonas marincola]